MVALRGGGGPLSCSRRPPQEQSYRGFHQRRVFAKLLIEKKDEIERIRAKQREQKEKEEKRIAEIKAKNEEKKKAREKAANEAAERRKNRLGRLKQIKAGGGKGGIAAAKKKREEAALPRLPPGKRYGTAWQDLELSSIS